MDFPDRYADWGSARAAVLVIAWSLACYGTFGLVAAWATKDER